jgi:hypothetical protein
MQTIFMLPDATRSMPEPAAKIMPPNPATDAGKPAGNMEPPR